MAAFVRGNSLFVCVIPPSVDGLAESLDVQLDLLNKELDDAPDVEGSEWEAPDEFRNRLVFAFKGARQDVVANVHYLGLKPVALFINACHADCRVQAGFSTVEGELGRQVTVDPFTRERYVWIEDKKIMQPEGNFLVANRILYGPTPDPQELAFRCVMLDTANSLSRRITVTAPSSTVAGRFIPWSLRA